MQTRSPSQSLDPTSVRPLEARRSMAALVNPAMNRPRGEKFKAEEDFRSTYYAHDRVKFHLGAIKREHELAHPRTPFNSAYAMGSRFTAKTDLEVFIRYTEELLQSSFHPEDDVRLRGLKYASDHFALELSSCLSECERYLDSKRKTRSNPEDDNIYNLLFKLAHNLKTVSLLYPEQGELEFAALRARLTTLLRAFEPEHQKAQPQRSSLTSHQLFQKAVGLFSDTKHRLPLDNYVINKWLVEGKTRIFFATAKDMIRGAAHLMKDLNVYFAERANGDVVEPDSVETQDDFYFISSALVYACSVIDRCSEEHEAALMASEFPKLRAQVEELLQKTNLPKMLRARLEFIESYYLVPDIDAPQQITEGVVQPFHHLRELRIRLDHLRANIRKEESIEVKKMKEAYGQLRDLLASVLDVAHDLEQDPRTAELLGTPLITVLIQAVQEEIYAVLRDTLMVYPFEGDPNVTDCHQTFKDIHANLVEMSQLFPEERDFFNSSIQLSEFWSQLTDPKEKLGRMVMLEFRLAGQRLGSMLARMGLGREIYALPQNLGERIQAIATRFMGTLSYVTRSLSPKIDFLPSAIVQHVFQREILADPAYHQDLQALSTLDENNRVDTIIQRALGRPLDNNDIQEICEQAFLYFGAFSQLLDLIYTTPTTSQSSSRSVANIFMYDYRVGDLTPLFAMTEALNLSQYWQPEESARAIELVGVVESLDDGLNSLWKKGYGVITSSGAMSPYYIFSSAVDGALERLRR